MKYKHPYPTLSALCLLGGLWIIGVAERNNLGEFSFSGVCFFKSVTGYPCPACGTTRSVIALTQGHWVDALWLNPLGFIVLPTLLGLSVWLLFDFLSHRQTLGECYKRIDRLLRRWYIWLPLVLLTLINWGWNLYKMSA
ncbi:MAG: DUF2752 domain-containing protein [Porphyromonas sp.]|nr:DUF2752 domain-containing protein [Porphyromonas sp.]